MLIFFRKYNYDTSSLGINNCIVKKKSFLKKKKKNSEKNKGGHYKYCHHIAMKFLERFRKFLKDFTKTVMKRINAFQAIVHCSKGNY